MKIRIRTASLDDVAVMHRIRCSVQENRLSHPQRVTRASYTPYVSDCSAWVAETDMGVAGFAIVDGPANSVWALFVDPLSEGAGIGRALHDRMLEWAREQGIDSLSLSTSTETRAEQFYKRSGWQETGLAPEGEVRFQKRLAP